MELRNCTDRKRAPKDINLHDFTQFHRKIHFLVNFKRASASYGGTINVIDIRETSEFLPATLFWTSDHPDHHLTKSRLKNVKKMQFFGKSQKIIRHVFQILRDFFLGTFLTNP